MRLDDFDYALPPELIAQYPPAQRTASRLLCVDGPSGQLTDRLFTELPACFAPGDLLVLNDTRVLNARLFGVKDSGGRCEVLVERVLDQRHALVQMRVSKPPRTGSLVRLAAGASLRVLERRGEFYRVRLQADMDLASYLQRFGAVPLPPYIDRAPDGADPERYQTVYARRPGAVAAPTAGLHFDHATLSELQARGVGLAFLTLHVGAGTFQPIRSEDPLEHKMHTEWFELPEATVAAIERVRREGGRVTAAGTTTLRALEAAAAAGTLRAGQAETDLYILPGFRFRVVERLLTNFHLPRSTLLMLVSAFGGLDLMRRAYQHAVRARYRFFSYGDAMLIERAPEAAA